MTDSSVSTILATLFGVAWTIGVASWFFSIVEAVGMWRFWRWTYRTGLKVLDEAIYDLPALNTGTPIDLPSARGEVRSPREIFFRVPFQWIGLKIHTPFPIKGTITLANGAARLVGRLPIGTVTFMAAWVIGWTAGGIAMLNSGNGASPLFLLSGWGFAALLIAISLPLELRRIRKARDALLQHLGQGGRLTAPVARRNR